MEEINFEDGDKVICQWNGREITDGILSIDEEGNIFLCSDFIEEGLSASDYKNKRHSWVIYQPDVSKEFEEQIENNNVRNLKLIEPKTLVITSDEISSAEYDSESAEMIKNGALRI